MIPSPWSLNSKGFQTPVASLSTSDLVSLCVFLCDITVDTTMRPGHAKQILTYAAAAAAAAIDPANGEMISEFRQGI